MILTSQICKHIVDICCYKCVYFDAISRVNKCSNSRKYSNVFTVFKTVLRTAVHFSANTKLELNDFDVPNMQTYSRDNLLQMCVFWRIFRRK